MEPKGSYVKYGLDPQENALKRGELPEGPDWGKEPEEAWGTLSLAEGDKVNRARLPTEPGDYREYYANVRDAIMGKAALAVTPQGALSVMRVLELARQAVTRDAWFIRLGAFTTETQSQRE